MDGRLGTAPDRSNLVLLAAQLIVEEALEAEVRDEVGRERYERADGEASGYRNGYRTGRMKTAEGVVESGAAGSRHGRTVVSGIPHNLAGRTGALEEFLHQRRRLRLSRLQHGQILRAGTLGEHSSPLSSFGCTSFSYFGPPTVRRKKQNEHGLGASREAVAAVLMTRPWMKSFPAPQPGLLKVATATPYWRRTFPECGERNSRRQAMARIERWQELRRPRLFKRQAPGY